MTGGLAHLALAVAVFLASHSLANLTGPRRRAEKLLGRLGFVLAYSAVSVALLVWTIAAYIAAPTVVLWPQEPWMRWVPPLAMLPASVLLAAGMTSPNPFSIGPGGKGFIPERPGILRLTRHPVLWGLALWAGAHIVPNGDVAALMLFVPLLLLALAGPAVLDRKRRRTLGLAEWTRLAALTGHPTPAMLAEMGWWRIGLGIGVYLLLFVAHEPVIGVTPIP
ncbi:MAG: NnrU family protein [Solirubrobacterales bacterium]